MLLKCVFARDNLTGMRRVTKVTVPGLAEIFSMPRMEIWDSVFHAEGKILHTKYQQKKFFSKAQNPLEPWYRNKKHRLTWLLQKLHQHPPPCIKPARTDHPRTLDYARTGGGKSRANNNESNAEPYEAASARHSNQSHYRSTRNAEHMEF